MIEYQYSAVFGLAKIHRITPKGTKLNVLIYVLIHLLNGEYS